MRYEASRLRIPDRIESALFLERPCLWLTSGGAAEAQVFKLNVLLLIRYLGDFLVQGLLRFAMPGSEKIHIKGRGRGGKGGKVCL